MLEHGGRLRAAAAQWGIPLTEWLDLSTGISPWAYPVSIPSSAWQSLPEDGDDLADAAARYYGHPAPLPLPGSQAAIQYLPQLLGAPNQALDVVLPTPTYGEYAPAWHSAGHRVREVPFTDLAAAISNTVRPTVLMLGNPNNPTGQTYSPEHLKPLATSLAAHGGWMVIDEAFADNQPSTSLAANAGTDIPNLIVLRSLGKFFGLAGARVGFLCAADPVRQQLAEFLGPWAVAHPSRIAATQALNDTHWQAEQKLRLADACRQLGQVLQRHGISSVSGGDLFHYAVMPHAASLFEHLALRGILVRQFAAPTALRFGLPATSAHWQRLDSALKEWNNP